MEKDYLKFFFVFLMVLKGMSSEIEQFKLFHIYKDDGMAKILLLTTMQNCLVSKMCLAYLDFQRATVR